MTEFLGEFLGKDFPSMAEQDEIKQHNQPIINALSIVVTVARRTYGEISAEYRTACKIFDDASKVAADLRKIAE
jgi:hypothetical protein